MRAARLHAVVAVRRLVETRVKVRQPLRRRRGLVGALLRLHGVCAARLSGTRRPHVSTLFLGCKAGSHQEIVAVLDLS